MSSGSFRYAPPQFARLLIFALAAVMLMAVDHRSGYLFVVREAVGVITYPVQLLARLPSSVAGAVAEWWSTRGELSARYAEEHERLLEMRARTLRLDALEHENRRLRELLGAAPRAADQLIIAELVDVSLDPFTQTIQVDKGQHHGIALGQPVVDAHGILGQVSRVTWLSSTVTLLTDPASAIPVQVLRNGLRGIVFGTGDRSVLDLPHLTVLADIRAGDVLVTSGLGGRFPPGYPVARVTHTAVDPDAPFLQVKCTPLARVDHVREVLLISNPEPRAGQAAGAGG